MLRLCFFLITSLLIFSNAYSQDLPFIVAPTTGTTLPTELVPGQTTVAYYTITNNTPISHAIHDNFVKYFPPNVSQEFSDATYTDICGQNFTLQPKGHANDSCTLKLKISGPVETDCGYDNAHGCLFVCMSDKTSCAGTKDPLHVAASVFVATGTSYNALQEYSPLAYHSIDGGQHWTISPTSIANAPDGYTQGVLNDVECVGENCSAVGYTFNPSYAFAPLSYKSNNAGVTWTAYQNVNLPDLFPNGTSGIFNKLSCSGSSCAVAGNSYYIYFTTPAAPLAYTNHDHQNWNISQTFPEPIPQTVRNTLWSVSCDGNYCSSVGQANNLYVTAGTPLGYYSSNSGHSWHLSSSFTVPSPKTQGLLFTNHCQAAHCVAAGVAYDNSYLDVEFHDPIPVSYVSNDYGNTWSSPTTLPQAGGKNYGYLSGVTCNGMTCVAVGRAYDNYDLDSIPTTYISNNGGTSWAATLTGLVLPAGKTQGLLYDISCVNTYCVAVGAAYTTYSNYYYRGLDPVSLVYTSTNSGQTWTLSPGLPLPAGASYGDLIGVSAGSH